MVAASPHGATTPNSHLSVHKMYENLMGMSAAWKVLPGRMWSWTKTAASSWFTWYTKAKEPIHLKQEVVLWTFPDKQSWIPSRNVLDATKHISRYWEPGFRKQYSIVEGDPWQSLNHHPTRSSGYFDVWDIHSPGWGNGCSHPAFQKNGSRLEIYAARMVWQEWFIYCAERFSVT